MVVYLPILTLTGVEGKMFVPMAFTVLLALVGAMILALTFVPAAVAIFLSREGERKREPRYRICAPGLCAVVEAQPERAASRRDVRAACLVALSLAARHREWGREFIPSLDEGDVLVQPVRMPGTSVTQSVEMSAALEKRLLKVPEVKEVFTRIGTAEVASDPMPPNIGDCYVMLKPRAEWPDPGKTEGRRRRGNYRRG